MDYKKWKSGRHDPMLAELRGVLPVHLPKRFRHVCKYCMEHKRDCPMCAGVY